MQYDISNIFNTITESFENHHHGFKVDFYIRKFDGINKGVIVTVTDKTTGYTSTARRLINFESESLSYINDRLCNYVDECYAELISKRNIERKHSPESKRIDILGTSWTIYEKAEKEDSLLKENNGYCDYTVKKIVVRKFEKGPDDYEDLEIVKKKVIRHEIIHAFLFESGLMENMHCTLDESTHDEQMVDWMAYQFPKILEVFKELDVL